MSRVRCLRTTLSLLVLAGCGSSTDKQIQLINVSGAVALLDAQGGPWTITAIDSMQAFSGNIERKNGVETDREGAFELKDVDVEQEVVLAVLAESTGGYPTVNVLAMYGQSNPPLQPKIDIANMPIAALRETTVAAWSSIPGFETIDVDGFVVGIVADENKIPLSGATIGLAAPGAAPLNVAYPGGTTATGPNGLFLVFDSKLQNPDPARVMNREMLISATTPGVASCTPRTAMIDAGAALFVPITCTR